MGRRTHCSCCWLGYTHSCMTACLADVRAVAAIIGQPTWLCTGRALALVATMLDGVVTLGCDAAGE